MSVRVHSPFLKSIPPGPETRPHATPASVDAAEERPRERSFRHKVGKAAAGILSLASMSAATLHSSVARADTTQSTVLPDAEKALQNHPWIVQDHAATPGQLVVVPTASAAPDEWLLGDSWAKQHDTSLSLHVRGGVDSKLRLSDDLSLARGLQGPSDRSLSLLSQDPGASTQAGADLGFQSKYLDLKLSTPVYASVGTNNLADPVGLYGRYANVPSQVQGIVQQARNLQGNIDTKGIATQLQGIQGDLQQLQSKVQRGLISPGDLAAQVNNLQSRVQALSPALGQVQSFVNGSAGVLGNAAQVASQFQDGTHRASFEVAGGAAGKLEIVGRLPIESPSRYLENLNLSVKGTGMYIPNNPAYDPSRTDVPQFQLLMGSMRANAQATLSGAGDVQQTIGDLQKLQQAASGTLQQLQQTLNQVQQAAGTVPTGPLQNTVKAAAQQAAQTGRVDPGTLQQAAQQLQQVAGQLQGKVPDLKPLQQQVDQLVKSGQAIQHDLDRLNANLHVATDLVMRTVQPTSNFGVGAGVGLSGTVRFPHDALKGLPNHVNFAVTVDNVFGYLPGKEEVWQMDGPALQQGDVRFHKLSATERNVFSDFNPLTFRTVLDTTVPATQTKLIGGVEKVDGIPGLTWYAGAEQPVTEWFRVRGGVLGQTASGTALYQAGIGVGSQKGPQLDLSAGTDSLNPRDAHQVAGSVGLRWDF